ncbi:MAG: hypothetical protein QM644_11525 [Mobilitalea sp.]
MKKNSIIYLFGNIIPVLISIIIYLTLPNTKLYNFWIGYDAFIVPVYLLLFNFLFSVKEFYIWKIVIIFVIEIICIIIHMSYFSFNLSATSFVVWVFLMITALVVIGIGSIILFIVSKKRAFITTY